jgi:flagellar assembly protein FliH
MLKAVFRPNELIPITDTVILGAPESFPELSQYKTVEEEVEEIVDVEEYTGPTADDLRREAEMFKVEWEEEKQRMISNARAEADNIIQDAQKAAFDEVQRKTDEAQVLTQQAEREAEQIISNANNKAAEIENEVRQTLEKKKKNARDSGREEGHEAGFAEGKAEVDRLIERTQTMLERAQDQRSKILKETEQEIVDLVLLISRKVIKVISENQRNIIVSNVLEALRKVRAKGDIIIRVNLADLQLATDHKQEFIKIMEGVKSIQIVEDSTVDSGGCIIETDFGEIDARISSQLTELENKILEISPMKSTMNSNIPVPIIRTANLNADLAASSALLNAVASDSEENKSDDDEVDLSPAASAALTASAALAALATLGTKGRRKTDADLIITPPRDQPD